MSNLEESLVNVIKGLIKEAQTDLQPVTPEPKEEFNGLPMLLDRVQMMELYKYKSPVTFKNKLDAGLIPKSTNTLGRKHLWNRDVVLKSISNG